MEKKTPLYEEHVNAGARIVPFAGFFMPLWYTGIIEEHRAVRTQAGMFDLSHMGEFRVSGEGALEEVDEIVTNDVRGMEVGQIRYTPMCYPDGGIVDDLLVYRYPDHLLLVVNAANIGKDLAWVREHVSADVRVDDISDQIALVAVQGPKAESILQPLTDVNLGSISYYHFVTGTVAGVEATISRTGYTGEDGFELYVDRAGAPRLWNEILTRGSPEGLRPAGLGARDTLRLEAGYMLYGNDIDETTSPLEAGLGWTVKFLDADFIGREALERQKAEGLRRRMVAVEAVDRSVPRQHAAIEWNGRKVGELTSGTMSPSLNKGIGLGYVETEAAKPGTDVQLDIRSRPHPARVVRKPVYKREGA